MATKPKTYHSTGRFTLDELQAIEFALEDRINSMSTHLAVSESADNIRFWGERIAIADNTLGKVRKMLNK